MKVEDIFWPINYKLPQGILSKDVIVKIDGVPYPVDKVTVDNGVVLEVTVAKQTEREPLRERHGDERTGREAIQAISKMRPTPTRRTP